MKTKYPVDQSRTVQPGDYYHLGCKCCSKPFLGPKRGIYCRICLDKQEEMVSVWGVRNKFTLQIVKYLFRRSRPFSWEAWAVYAGISVDDAVNIYEYFPTVISKETLRLYNDTRYVP